MTENLRAVSLLVVVAAVCIAEHLSQCSRGSMLTIGQ